MNEDYFLLINKTIDFSKTISSKIFLDIKDDEFQLTLDALQLSEEQIQKFESLKNEFFKIKPHFSIIISPYLEFEAGKYLSSPDDLNLDILTAFYNYRQIFKEPLNQPIKNKTFKI